MPKTFRNKENKGLQPFCSGDCRLMAGPGIKLYHRVAARISKILLTKEERPFTANIPRENIRKKALRKQTLRTKPAPAIPPQSLFFRLSFHFERLRYIGNLPGHAVLGSFAPRTQRSPEGRFLPGAAVLSSRICQRSDPGYWELCLKPYSRRPVPLRKQRDPQTAGSVPVIIRRTGRTVIRGLPQLVPRCSTPPLLTIATPYQ